MQRPVIIANSQKTDQESWSRKRGEIRRRPARYAKHPEQVHQQPRQKVTARIRRKPPITTERGTGT